MSELNWTEAPDAIDVCARKKRNKLVRCCLYGWEIEGAVEFGVALDTLLGINGGKGQDECKYLIETLKGKKMFRFVTFSAFLTSRIVMSHDDDDDDDGRRAI